MRVLVTGGCGVIGSTIARLLLERGHAPVIIDSCEEPRNEWIAAGLEPRAPVHRWRIEQNFRNVCEVLPEVDAVIHCAASTGIPYSVGEPSDDWARNVDATKTLLDALRVHPKPTVVLSSIKPYRVLPMPENGLDESAVLDPDEPYAASKAAQSMLCMAYAHSYGLPVVCFRCSNLYAGAPSHGPRHGWMTWMAISAVIGRPLVVQGSGEQTRDMLHGLDVYEACMAALDGVTRKGEMRGAVYNLGGGAPNRVSVNSVANYLHDKTGIAVSYGPARAMDDLHVFVNHDAFTRATGWQPQVGVLEGLASLVDWAARYSSELEVLYRDVQ